MTREHALKLRKLIEKASATLDDETALDGVELFPAWKENASYSASDRVRYDGVLYKCLADHTAQYGWIPTAAPSLWAEVLAGQQGTEIGEWTQPDSTNPYMTGDKVLYGGVVWMSSIDNNVWAPDVYGWQRV